MSREICSLVCKALERITKCCRLVGRRDDSQEERALARCLKFVVGTAFMN